MTVEITIQGSLPVHDNEEIRNRMEIVNTFLSQLETDNILTRTHDKNGKLKSLTLWMLTKNNEERKNFFGRGI